MGKTESRDDKNAQETLASLSEANAGLTDENANLKSHIEELEAELKAAKKGAPSKRNDEPQGDEEKRFQGILQNLAKGDNVLNGLAGIFMLLIAHYDESEVKQKAVENVRRAAGLYR